jgi:DNA invertase Pin-like site-specific DNA recombinase
MRRAVEYVRMSTDHQKYSTENQSDAIRKYAAERGENGSAKVGHGSGVIISLRAA